MNVKNIIKLVAIYLQMEEVLELTTFGGTVTDVDANDITLKNVELLTRCLNLVYDEIATDYIALTATEDVEVTKKEIDLESLTKRLVSVVRISDTNGKLCKYKMYPSFILIANGNYSLTYSYMPTSVTINDDIENFSGKLTERIAAYGVASEYCIISGLFEEAYMWESRFKDSLLVAKRNKHEINMPARRWF